MDAVGPAAARSKVASELTNRTSIQPELGLCCAPANLKDRPKKLCDRPLGFQTREAPRRRRRSTAIPAPTDQLNLRAEIADIDRFLEWCEQNRYSYREGFAKLVRLIDTAL